MFPSLNCISGKDRKKSRLFPVLSSNRDKISAASQLTLTNVYVMQISEFYRINPAIFREIFCSIVAFQDLKLTNQSIAC